MEEMTAALICALCHGGAPGTSENGHRDRERATERARSPNSCYARQEGIFRFVRHGAKLGLSNPSRTHDITRRASPTVMLPRRGGASSIVTTLASCGCVLSFDLSRELAIPRNSCR